jgi:hypothetical protein
MASEYYAVPLIKMMMGIYINSPTKETMNAMVLGILNYYFPQSLDYAMDFLPRLQADWNLNVDLAIRRWYPEAPAKYELANQALVDIQLGTGKFREQDCEEIKNKLSVFVDKDKNNTNDCWFILFHGMFVRFYLWRAGDDDEEHLVISYPLEDDEDHGRDGTPAYGFHLIEDHEQVDYILRRLAREGCV